MDALTQNVDWIATVVGAVAAFLVGWLWYSPKLFGEKWAAGVGVQLDKVDRMPVAAMVTQMAGTVLLSWVIAVTMAVSLGVTVLVVATIACLMIASGYFCQKSTYAIATEAGFVVVMAIIMVAAQLLI